MLGDLKVVGFSQELPRSIVASTTRFYAGEPLHGLGTITAGAINTPQFVPAAANTPVIGTHRFGGIAIKNALPSTGTVAAHFTMAACPIADLGRIRGLGDTYANIDTLAEALALIGAAVLIKYAATGSPSSGPLYTILTTPSANTSGLEIVAINIARGTVDTVVEPRAYRNTVS